MTIIHLWNCLDTCIALLQYIAFTLEFQEMFQKKNIDDDANNTIFIKIKVYSNDLL